MATWTNKISAVGAATIIGTNTATGSSVISLSETIAGSATTQISVAIDVSALKAIAIKSTVATTLKTNSSGSPDDTIVLVADQPYVWFTGDYNASLLTVDITSIFFVVAGATAGTLTIEGVQDATP